MTGKLCELKQNTSDKNMIRDSSDAAQIEVLLRADG